MLTSDPSGGNLYLASVGLLLVYNWMSGCKRGCGLELWVLVMMTQDRKYLKAIFFSLFPSFATPISNRNFISDVQLKGMMTGLHS